MGDDERQEQQDLYRAGPMPHLPESKDRDPEKRALAKKCQAALDELARSRNYPAFEERLAEITMEHRHLYAQEKIPIELHSVSIKPGESRESFEQRQKQAQRAITRLNEANHHNAAMLRHCEDVLAKRDERIEREGMQGADVQPEDDGIPF